MHPTKKINDLYSNFAIVCSAHFDLFTIEADFDHWGMMCVNSYAQSVASI